MTQELGPLQLAWVEALESGKYQQTTNNLHQIDFNRHSFCCLGVMCELTQELFQLIRDDKMYYDDNAYFLPERAKKQFRLSEKGLRHLIVFNDVKYKSFKEIAESVRDNPKMFFKEVV